jgi:hypothetical protein
MCAVFICRGPEHKAAVTSVVRYDPELNITVGYKCWFTLTTDWNWSWTIAVGCTLSDILHKVLCNFEISIDSTCDMSSLRAASNSLLVRSATRN